MTQRELDLQSIAVGKLKEEQQQYSDFEVAHVNADQILCVLLIELGFQEVVDEFRKIGKWYS